MFKIIDEKFYIYGAGQYAKEFLFYLKMIGADQRIKGFIVSKCRGVEQQFYDYPLYEYERVRNQINGETIYIAISAERNSGVQEKLSMINCGQVIQLTGNMYSEIQCEILKEYNTHPIKNDQVIFWNYWGLGYFDNCKYIAEELHRVNSDINIVWALEKSVDDLPQWITPVFMGTEEYYDALCTSRVLITNVNSPIGSKLKRKEQLYIYTWHGIGPTKRLEWQSPIHRIRDNNSEIVKERWNAANLMIAGSDFCHKVYRESFLYEGVIENWGYPRNDIFFRHNMFKKEIHEKYGIPMNKKIVLYAPTFRNEIMQSGDTEKLKSIYDIDLNMIKNALEDRFGVEYAVMYRLHHYIYRYADVSKYQQFGIDVTGYSDMQHLLVAADVLITDYSSSMWDFSLSRKPVFLYYHDAQEYQEKYKGFYVFPDDYPYPKGHTNEELCEEIASFNDGVYQENLDKWFAKYGTFDDGHASRRVTERILDVINNPTKYEK